jgi:ABC-type branched-subunit amino acid transport system ATPase component
MKDSVTRQEGIVTTPADVILSVRKLRREFGGVIAVADASFDVERGRITVLIGPNGAGKSTVLNVIAGAIAPTAGTVLLEGRDISGAPAHAVAQQGVIRTFQLASEFPHMTVMENLMVAPPRQIGEALWSPLRGKRLWRDQEVELVDRARPLLKRFGLADKEDEYASNLSGGQKRLLEISRALMAEPRLLLVDEPMAGVHPSMVERIEGHLTDLRSQGLSILMVEHEFDVVERISDRVIVMSRGEVISAGTMAEIRSSQLVVDAYIAG